MNHRALNIFFYIPSFDWEKIIEYYQVDFGLFVFIVKWVLKSEVLPSSISQHVRYYYFMLFSPFIKYSLKLSHISMLLSFKETVIKFSQKSINSFFFFVMFANLCGGISKKMDSWCEIPGTCWVFMCFHIYYYYYYYCFINRNFTIL